jgi:hypothetical protein
MGELVDYLGLAGWIVVGVIGGVLAKFLIPGGPWGNSPDKDSRKRFIIWMSVYVVVVLAASTAFNNKIIPASLTIPAALLPMIPATLAGFASLDGFRAMDELQRKIQSEGILFAFFATAIVTFSYGFLEVYAGFPRQSMFFVWAVLALSWCTGSALATRRYR